MLLLDIQLEIDGSWSGSCDSELVAVSQTCSLQMIAKAKEVSINGDRRKVVQTRQYANSSKYSINSIEIPELHTPSSSLP